MVTNSNRQPIANTRRTHSESIAQFHLTRIDGNCWKGTAKEHTGEMVYPMPGKRVAECMATRLWLYCYPVFYQALTLIGGFVYAFCTFDTS